MDKRELFNLFKWCRQTKQLAEQKVLSEELFNEIVSSQKKLFTSLSLEDKLSIFNARYMDYPKNNDLDFWIKQFVPKEEVVPFLTKLMYTASLYPPLVISLANMFLQLPKESRESFYKINHLQSSGKKTRICGINFFQGPVEFHHSLHVLLDSHYDNESEQFYKIKEVVKNDIKELMGDDDFIKTFVPGYIYKTKLNEVIQNFNTWKIKENKVSEHMLGLCFFKKRIFYSPAYKELLISKKIPSDLKLMNTDDYLIDYYILEVIEKFKANLLAYLPEEMLIKFSQKNIVQLEELKGVDLSCLNQDKINEKLDKLSKEISSQPDLDKKTIGMKLFLDFSLTLSNLTKPIEKIEKKMKI